MLLGGAAGAVALAACGGDKKDDSAAASSTCTPIPAETGGPFPGDGSNGSNVLDQSGVVRSDIRSSFGSASGTAEGAPMEIDLTIVRAAGCTPYEGAAVYVWHCDREGRYSMYSQGATDQNYLRGVQSADANGRVSFASIFPAAYPGRWPHVHFEIYPSASKATTASSRIRTSQLALPEAACNAVYAANSGYESSKTNMARTSLSSDMVFADGYSQQMAKVTTGPDVYRAELTVAV